MSVNIKLHPVKRWNNMSFSCGVVTLCLCFNIAVGVEDQYRAAYIKDWDRSLHLSSYTSFIQDAGKSNVDLLVLSSTTTEDYFNVPDKYDEVVKTVSAAAKSSGIYVVVHLLEKLRCQNKNEVVRSNLVFDRQGAVIASYRKPINSVANCSAMSTEVTTFSTDFGVNFALFMEEDMVVQNMDNINLKNIVMAGRWNSQIPFLNAPNFSPSWAYHTDSNLVSSSGIFSGKGGAQGEGSHLVVADLKKDGVSGTHNPPVVVPPKPEEYLADDWSHYVIKQLKLEDSLQGYENTVCHGEFCCHFDLKTRFDGVSPSGVKYVLAANNGLRRMSGAHHAAVQICALFAHLDKRTSSTGIQTNNGTNIHVERISITGNFTGSGHFPIIASLQESSVNFKFDSSSVNDHHKVSAEIVDAKNLLGFGLFGRHYQKDIVSTSPLGKNADSYNDSYDLINEDFQEFFDYVWIRLRILIFVVSIYILEMM